MNIFINYFTIAIRQITRHKLFTVINVFGLAMSMSIGMLIIAMIFSLLKFDEFHENKDRIFRVVSKVNEANRPEDDKAIAPLPLAERLQSLSAVEKTIRSTHASLWICRDYGNGHRGARVVGNGFLQHRTQNKGDRHPESFRSRGLPDCCFAFEGFCVSAFDCCLHRAATVVFVI